MGFASLGPPYEESRRISGLSLARQHPERGSGLNGYPTTARDGASTPGGNRLGLITAVAPLNRRLTLDGIGVDQTAGDVGE